MRKIAALTLVLISISCAHHRDVRPTDEGVHKVVLLTEDKDAGYRDAMSQANHYCKEEEGNKRAVVVTEGSKYTGSMDESTYKTSKTAAKVAKGVGSAAWVFGGKNESTAGGIVGLGGGIADGAIGSGYTYEMKFKCR